MITKRAEEIRPFIVMDVLERAQELESQGEHVIHLEVGEPDFDTPACIRAAGEKALREGKTHYTHSQGLLELRQAICESYRERYGVEITRLVMASYMAAEYKKTLDLTDPAVQKELETYVPAIQQGHGADVLF